MMDVTDRLALPLIAPGQAQKEMMHNEALTTLDALAQASVLSAGVDTPPAGPTAGQCWIVGTAPTGDWSDRAGAIAMWTTGGWRFQMPFEGMAAWVADQSALARFRAGDWRTGDLGALATAPIPAPVGGATVDTEARATIAEILAALQNHGLVAGT